MQSDLRVVSVPPLSAPPTEARALSVPAAVKEEVISAAGQSPPPLVTARRHADMAAALISGDNEGLRTVAQ
eukprot:COSAG02_NODE_30179_length_556_cov_0.452954_1_plen_70_part_10